MATIHLDAAGSNTSPYDTWAKAATSWATAVAALAAGDSLVMSSTYSQSMTGDVSAAFPGTATSPNRVMCGTKAATSGLSALVPGATLTSTSGGASISGCAYVYGITFKSTSVSTITPSFGGVSGSMLRFDHCALDYASASSDGNAIWFGSPSDYINSDVSWRNSSFRLGSAGQTINLTGTVRFETCFWSAGGVTPLVVFAPASNSGRPTMVRVYGFDFATLGTGVNIFSAPTGGVFIDAANLNLPTGWTGKFVNGGLTGTGGEISVVNSDGSAIPFGLYKLNAAGSAIHEKTIVRTGGASYDGSTVSSWKIASETDCSLVNVLRSPRRAIANDTAGSAVTLTIEIENDGTTLTDQQVALCASVMENTGSTAYATYATSKPDAITAASNLPTSTATWTTTGQTSPVKQKIALTFTPQHAGPIEWWVEVYTPSKTLYVDPMVTVS